jgi:hypothetical protein
MFNGAAIDELVKDAMHFTLLSSTRDSTVVRNASLALAWLEAVFTGYTAWSEGAGKEAAVASFMLKAYAHVPLDASLLLQVSSCFCNVISGKIMQITWWSRPDSLIKWTICKGDLRNNRYMHGYSTNTLLPSTPFSITSV